MSGRRHVVDSAGTRYEDFVKLVLGEVASLVKVPREEDFGVDFYLQPKVAVSEQTETVTELAAVQVKGGNETLVYGGRNGRGEWREYEFSWLRSLAIPLYLATVNKA